MFNIIIINMITFDNNLFNKVFVNLLPLFAINKF